MALTKHQIDTLIIIERVTASISVFATLILISSFLFIKPFRTLSNTLIFYASFANIFANIAALIGGSALGNTSSPLCQFQGFLLEMFMQSDPMWSCAMAVNVYLVFFRRYDASRLKRLYWFYGLLCYGLPFIPAMFCLFYGTESKGKMYGDATLWCWIDSNWAPVRIYSYYAPIWVSILATFIIYIRVGVEIFQKRSQLQEAGYDSRNNQYMSGTLSLVHDTSEAPFSGLRTTEIEVSTDAWNREAPKGPVTAPAREGVTNTTEKPKPSGIKDQYSVTISSVNRISSNTPKSPGFATPRFLPRRPNSMDKIKWAYTKCALLFAISILITWVPPSANRVYGLRYPHNPSFALNIGSALVLPLQGFWNTIIYFMTSMSICRNCWADFQKARQQKRERKSNKKLRRELNVPHRGEQEEGGPTTVINAGDPGKACGAVTVEDSDSSVEVSETKNGARTGSESC